MPNTIQSLKEEVKHRDEIIKQEVGYKVSERNRFNEIKNVLVNTKFLQEFDEKTITNFKKIFGVNND
jgi:hypothetical protein